MSVVAIAIWSVIVAFTIKMFVSRFFARNQDEHVTLSDSESSTISTVIFRECRSSSTRSQVVFCLRKIYYLIDLPEAARRYHRFYNIDDRSKPMIWKLALTLINLTNNCRHLTENGVKLGNLVNDVAASLLFEGEKVISRQNMEVAYRILIHSYALESESIPSKETISSLFGETMGSLLGNFGEKIGFWNIMVYNSLFLNHDYPPEDF
jgi:hypothetical protein